VLASSQGQEKIVKRLAVVGVLGALFSLGAEAQSRVTLYGLIDSGLTYASNDGGNSAWKAVSGVPVGSNYGFRGSEDLGGGLSAVFQLENGFDGFTGNGSGRAFNRQAKMGLSSKTLGTLTLGRQYDSIVDFVAPYTSNGAYAGWYFSHPQDVDNTDNGFIVSNSVKYRSIDYNGLSFGGLYAFGNVVGDFHRNSVWSVGMNYANGPIGFGAAFLRAASPGTGLDGFYMNSATYTNTVYGKYLPNAEYENIAGAGVSYAFGKAKLMGSFTNTVFVGGASGHNASFKNVELAFGYQLQPEWYLLGSYTYTFGNDNATGDAPKYHQVNFMADYLLSKRTDIYLMAVYQRAAGSASVAQITGFGASSTRAQAAFRLGLKHTF